MRRRLLVVLEAGAAYPSGFVRGLIFEPQWREAGYDVTYVSRLWPPLVRWLDAPPAWSAPVMAAGLGAALAAASRILGRLREWGIVRRAQRADVVQLVKAASPTLVDALRQHTRARLVLDVVDALWLPRYRIPALPEMLARVDAVTTDNEVTAAYLRQFHHRCAVVPDPPQVEWFDRRLEARVSARADERCVIGWVGSPGTTPNLRMVWDVLEEICERHPHVHVRLVGADARVLPTANRMRWSHRLRYTQADLVEEVRRMDIGLFPLEDDEAGRVRGVLKAAVYMAGGVCVVASPVGQVPSFLSDGETGWLASSPGDWRRVLDRLVCDPATRRRVAEAGRAHVGATLRVRDVFKTLHVVVDPDGVRAEA